VKFLDYLDLVEKFENKQMPAELSSGVQTPWPNVNELLRPVRGEVTVVTGTPGSGKSEWLFSLALHLAQEHRWRFVLAPFEHKLKDLALIFLEKQYQVPWKELRKLESFDVTSALTWFEDHFRRLGEFSEELQLQDILNGAAARAEELKDQGGLQGLIIDPYNYIEKGNINEHQHVSNLMSELQQFAKAHATHIWIVVHPTKGSQLKTPAGEKGDPSMYDCTGSSHWYNKCDNGVYVRRPYKGQGKDGDQNPHQVDIMVKKVRNYYAGTPGTAHLVFDPWTRGYREM